MNTYSFYYLASGLFTGITIQCVADHLQNNVPDDCGWILGVYDALSQKVDLNTGEVVDYQPAQPSENHIWDTASHRWVYMPTLADHKAKKLKEINDRCADLLAGVREGYPPDEVNSWSKQENEARAYTANNSAPTPLLSALSIARGVPLADLAARVIEKADLFATTSGQIIGKRQRCEDAINAAQTIEDVEAITWPE